MALNKAFFVRLMVDGKKVIGHTLREPFDALDDAYRQLQVRSYPRAGSDRGTRQRSGLDGGMAYVATCPTLADEDGAPDDLSLTGSLALTRPSRVRGSSKTVMVDILRHYWNRSDLLDDLDRTMCQLERAVKRADGTHRSVASTGRMNRKWALQDRLSTDDMRGVVEGFRAGTSKLQLAKQYGISESSVKRILRLHRAAERLVECEVSREE